MASDANVTAAWGILIVSNDIARVRTYNRMLSEHSSTPKR